jgi:drug/metabolite transporter (DMT)-like permease
VTGLLLAAGAGVGFGFFQAVNRRALRGMTVADATLLQLVVGAIALAVVVPAAGKTEAFLDAPAVALAEFAAAGCIHFVAGNLLVSVAQQRLGAISATPLLATAPLFGTAWAALSLNEVPGRAAMAGLLTMTLGVLLLSLRRAGPADARARLGGVGVASALGAALCWSISPIFIRKGLERAPSPLVGLGVGMVAAALLYLPIHAARPGRRERMAAVPRPLLWAELAAAAVVTAATLSRWEALDLAPVGVVLALTLLSVPTVLALAPRLAGADGEHRSLQVLVGSSVVVGGAVVLLLFGGRVATGAIGRSALPRGVQVVVDREPADPEQVGDRLHRPAQLEGAPLVQDADHGGSLGLGHLRDRPADLLLGERDHRLEGAVQVGERAGRERRGGLR